MAPALMVCWIEGGAVFFLFSVFAWRRRRATGSIAAGTWRRRPSAGILFIPCSLRPAPRRTTSAGGGDSRFSGSDGARAVGRRAASAGTGSRRSIAGCCARRRGYSLSLARSDLRRAERHLPAAAIPVLAEVMELGRWGDERHRQVRGLADRSPGVAHGGGDTLYPLLAPTCAAPNDICRRRRFPF